jgi:hypothetical protein
MIWGRRRPNTNKIYITMKRIEKRKEICIEEQLTLDRDVRKSVKKDKKDYI